MTLSKAQAPTAAQKKEYGSSKTASRPQKRAKTCKQKFAQYLSQRYDFFLRNEQ
jgi:hypothetical protein